MLEYIVRPFQAPNAHGTIIISSNPKETEERAVITWGGEATLPAVQYIETGFNTKKNREDFVEQNRDAEVVRIEGNDPENWIDVSRSNKLYLDKHTSQDMNASDAGQSSYVSPGVIPAGFLADHVFTPDTKATIELKNNTAAAGG